MKLALVLLFFFTLQAAAILPSDVVQQAQHVTPAVIDLTKASPESAKLIAQMNENLSVYQPWYIPYYGPMASENATIFMQNMRYYENIPASLVAWEKKQDALTPSIARQTAKNVTE
jgi:hypothetical protein